jgi:hypothetical protein
MNSYVWLLVAALIATTGLSVLGWLSQREWKRIARQWETTAKRWQESSTNWEKAYGFSKDTIDSQQERLRLVYGNSDVRKVSPDNTQGWTPDTRLGF